jgi:hypothetical protein
MVPALMTASAGTSCGSNFRLHDLGNGLGEAFLHILDRGARAHYPPSAKSFETAYCATGVPRTSVNSTVASMRI